MCIVAVELSRNSKTGPVAATYAPIASCPKDCPFLGQGCYGQTGRVGLVSKRIETRLSKAEIARREAALIRALPGTLPLRLHVVGDAATPQAARVIAAACADYSAKHGQPVWTYTHAWKRVPRDAWGEVSVLASCETTQEAKAAIARGYAVALVSDIERTEKRDGLTLIPCPNQRNKSYTCTMCKFCFRDQSLITKKRVVCLAPHGSGTKKVREIVKTKGGVA